jgi:hypothetical protein
VFQAKYKVVAFLLPEREQCCQATT